MTIFKQYTYSWKQMGVLKLALLCFGIVIGAHWHSFFAGHLLAVLIVGLVLALYIGIISFR